MFKKILLGTVILALAGALTLGTLGCSLAQGSGAGAGQGGSGGGAGQGASGGGAGQGASGSGGAAQPSGGQGGAANAQGKGGNRPTQAAAGSGSGAGAQAYLPTAIPGSLSGEESAALLYMREEEKLAYDVYTALFEQWALPTFQRISQSEATHSEAVKTLLERYGLDDPAPSAAGVFSNPDLQALYNDLLARAEGSLAEALKVGGAIEEIDILDLQERLAQTDNADIQQVFNSLAQGSHNHLREFASTLQAQSGETYQPQYMSDEALQSILSASNSRGASGKGNQSGGRGYRGGRR